MSTLPPELLQWLARVLAPKYRNVNRTYSDAATVLQAYRSLSVKTDVYTYEDGLSELLLCISGTLPVSFRGGTYNIPIAFWIPHQYPAVPPIALVVASNNIMIRPTNHVDAGGRCYHPYLAHWTQNSDTSSLIELCTQLKDVFGKEPPAYAKQQQRQQAPYHTPSAAQPDMQYTAPISTGPVLPPKPSALESLHNTPPVGTTATPVRAEQAQPVPPPKPPLPEELSSGSTMRILGHDQPYFSSALTGYGGGMSISTFNPDQINQQRQVPAPPVVPVPPKKPDGPAQLPPQHQSSTVFTHFPQRHSSFEPQYTPHPGTPQQHPQPQGTSPSGNLSQQVPFSAVPRNLSMSPTQRPNSVHGYLPQPPPTSLQGQPHQTLPHPPQPRQYHSPQLHAQPVKSPLQVVNLMDMHDNPRLSFKSANAMSVSSTPPQPPPNPEKDRLIRDVSRALQERAEADRARAQQSLDQTSAQRDALLQTEAGLERERQELERINEMCVKNNRILQERIVMAEDLIRNVGEREAPNIDTVVVAPTIVHTQLYDLATEDMAIEDTIYVLGKALDKERITLDVFLKHTRILAREQFLKRALVKKISRQIGLD